MCWKATWFASWCCSLWARSRTRERRERSERRERQANASKMQLRIDCSQPKSSLFVLGYQESSVCPSGAFFSASTSVSFLIPPFAAFAKADHAAMRRKFSCEVTDRPNQPANQPTCATALTQQRQPKPNRTQQKRTNTPSFLRQLCAKPISLQGAIQSESFTRKPRRKELFRHFRKRHGKSRDS